jgi:hypothetical protein
LNHHTQITKKEARSHNLQRVVNEKRDHDFEEEEEEKSF